MTSYTRFLLPFLIVSTIMTSTPSLPKAPLMCLTAGLSPDLITLLGVSHSLMLFCGSISHMLYSFKLAVVVIVFGDLSILKVSTSISIASC